MDVPIHESSLSRVFYPELSNLRIIIFHKKSRKQVFSSRCSVDPNTKFENSKIRDKKDLEKKFENSQIRDNEDSENNSKIRKFVIILNSATL